MDPAALPAAGLQHPPDRVGEAHVGVADHQLDASEAALLERANELAPEALGFAVTYLQAKQFTAAVGMTPMAIKAALEQTCRARPSLP
jgi:hypothetical protein